MDEIAGGPGNHDRGGTSLRPIPGISGVVVGAVTAATSRERARRKHEKSEAVSKPTDPLLPGRSAISGGTRQEQREQPKSGNQ